MPRLVALLLAFLLVLPTAQGFVPSNSPTSSASASAAARTSAAMALPSASSAAIPGRRSIFPPPLMDSFYGEQRKRLQEEEQQAQMQWANEFNSLLVTRGQDVCAMGYEGFLRTGSKGAVACYYDGDESGPLSQCSLVYTTLEELLSDDRLDSGVKEQMAERVMAYDPEAEVAVMFAFKGQVGLNVIRPTYSPKLIYDTANRK